MRVLFVCTGNTCRSPMAEAYAARRFRLAGRPDLEARSAGCAADGGSPASSAAIDAMRELGIDLRNFRSTRLSESLIAEADLILCMTGGHRRQVLFLMPEAAEKCRLLQESSDVPDPFGGGAAEYRAVLSAMLPALDGWIDRLLATAPPKSPQ